ncbi:MAG TPA: alcohol dehydrogenase catalytic domain-containing protein, partial [Tepidiformaceae bacterium]|nr:alcohol dehydrogenase catalytic domain-containing protein [Tepidiformaceae bacterium]
MPTATETRKDLYDLGEMPPLGYVPAQMHAQVIRQSRFGGPMQAFQREVIHTPEIGPDDALVYVMAAGVNYNNIWAGLGSPVDTIGARMKTGDTDDHHIGGSDASGIVWATGENVTNIKVGDEVVIHCGQWDIHAP